MELPDVNGLDLLDQIGARPHPHVVFITGHGDIPTSVRAIKAGAVDFLTKPLKEADLIRAIHDAIAKDRIAMRERAELAGLRGRLSSLTPREREVLPLVVSGLLNKQAAGELGISEITIQIHRGRIMKKMGAGSLAELVRMAGTLADSAQPRKVRASPGRPLQQEADGREQFLPIERLLEHPKVPRPIERCLRRRSGRPVMNMTGSPGRTA